MLSSDAWLPSHPSACPITNSLSLSLFVSVCFVYISMDLSSSLSTCRFSALSHLSDFCCILMKRWNAFFSYTFLTLSEVPFHFSSFFHILVSQSLPVKMGGRDANKGESRKKKTLSSFSSNCWSSITHWWWLASWISCHCALTAL